MAIKEIVKGTCGISRCKYDVYTKEKTDELLSELSEAKANVSEVYDKEETDTLLSGIIESGNNENGYYAKYSDGTLICKGKATAEANTNVVEVTFPKSYNMSADVEVVITNKFTHSYKVVWSAIVQNGYYFKAWPVDITTGTTPTTKVDFGYIAFGSWK